MHSLVKDLCIFSGILFFLYLSHQPALQGYYIFHDDVLFWEKSAPAMAKYPLHDISVAMGRPIGAGLITLCGWMIHDVSDLNFLRFICLFQLSLSAMICFAVLKRRLAHPITAFLIAVTIFTLPPFQVMVFWMGACHLSTAVLLATLAGFMACKVPLDQPFRKNTYNKYSILAGVLLLCSILTYAPAATFYWAFLGLVILSFRTEPYARLKKTVLNFLYAGMASHVIYGLYLMLAKNHYVRQVRGIYNPYVLNTDYFGKLKWFLSEPVYNGLNLWNIFPSGKSAGIVFLLIFIPFVYVLVAGERKHQRPPAAGTLVRREMFCVFVFLLIMVLSFLPNLVSTGEAPFYRCLGGLMTLFFVMLVWAFMIWARLISPGHPEKVLIFLLIICSIYAVYTAHRTVLLYRVIPSQNEWRALVEQLKRTDVQSKEPIEIVLKEIPSSQIRYDEYGILTMTFGHDVELMVRCALREAGMEGRLSAPSIKIKIGYPKR